MTVPKPRTATDRRRWRALALVRGAFCTVILEPGDRGRRAVVDSAGGTERLTIAYLPVFAITIGS